MNEEHTRNLETEGIYLGKTLELINNKLEEEQIQLSSKRKDLISFRRDMYDNTNHYSNDFDKLTEMVQHLSSVEVRTYDMEDALRRIEKYKKLKNSPYFARIDFTEDGYERESIYIGIGSLTDDATGHSYVYDWRAPVSSIFYRYELGRVTYLAPCGIIEGEVDLKRQYEIRDGKLEFFFDSGVSIMDDVLKRTLSGNTSAKMKTIVETIQREQDIVIRDIENDLLIVQGVAGSGKTSVALHRVAFLLYQGTREKLDHTDIILISPNTLFESYISNVLPELGEELIDSLTFEDMFEAILGKGFCIKSRNALLEEIITSEDAIKKDLIKSSLVFKLSTTFLSILERFIKHFEHKMIWFCDIYFDGQHIMDRHSLKADFLDKRRRYVPVEKRLEQIEDCILKRLHALREKRLSKLERFVYENTDHPFDAKSFARLISMKQSAALLRTIRKFTQIDYLELYKKIFADKELFFRLSEGLDLPYDIDRILDLTNENLSTNKLGYEDAMVLMLLKIKMSGLSMYSSIKQVVVDEVQDYHPVHFEILKLLFANAKYTVVGDINQTIERTVNGLSIYECIKVVLNKPRNTLVLMNKSYRCSYEINKFSSQFADGIGDMESVERHEQKPDVKSFSGVEELDEKALCYIEDCFMEGFSSIAIICKSLKQARELFARIHLRAKVRLISEDTTDTVEGALIVPVYLSKGLEFDAVLVYGTDESGYKTADDKKLLYIACTRALHRLALYYTGIKSRFI